MKFDILKSHIYLLLFHFVKKIIIDPEYKLKSANQTPTALNNALTNSHEITRSIMDERKAYIKGVRKKNYGI